MLSSRVAKAVAEALSEGVQVGPEALSLLVSISEKLDPVEIVNKAIREVRKTHNVTTLTQEELSKVLPVELLEYDQSNIVEPDVIGDLTIDLKVSNDISVLPPSGIEAFHGLLLSRFSKLLKILQERPDSSQIISISALKVDPKRTQRIVGLVLDKSVRRNGIVLVIDDMNAKITCIISADELKNDAMSILLDQMVMLDIIVRTGGVSYVKNIYSPDVPEHIPILAKNAIYAVFTSDLQIGSKNFLEDEFRKFVSWISGKTGDSYVTKRIRYLVIAGDLVDGIGVYPGQDKDLEISDISSQYKHASDLLKMVPSNIKIIIIPGNHDVSRQALPRPPIPRKYCEELYEMANVKMLGDPCFVSLHGIKVLISHGKSLDDILSTIPGLSFSRPALGMKLLLKARHVSPMYSRRTPLAPEFEDRLVIEEVPDIFHSGHIHTVDSEKYKGILLLNSGTWQGQTPFQASRGILPVSAIVPVVNLSTMEVFTRNFSTGFEAEI